MSSDKFGPHSYWTDRCGFCEQPHSLCECPKELVVFARAHIEWQDYGKGLVSGATLRTLIERSLAWARDRQQSGPSREGWLLVPEEATAEMIQAAEDRQVEGASYIAESSIQFALWREVWRAMLAAAPKQSTATSSSPIPGQPAP